MTCKKHILGVLSIVRKWQQPAWGLSGWGGGGGNGEGGRMWKSTLGNDTREAGNEPRSDRNEKKRWSGRRRVVGRRGTFSVRGCPAVICQEAVILLGSCLSPLDPELFVIIYIPTAPQHSPEESPLLPESPRTLQIQLETRHEPPCSPIRHRPPRTWTSAQRQRREEGERSFSLQLSNQAAM